MIGIDTNVLVRYYVDDSTVQHKRATRFIDRNEIFVNNLVILETFWILTSVYCQPPDRVSEIFNHLKRLSNVQFENPSAVSLALFEHVTNGCDFADAMIGAINKGYGHATATFDRTAMKKLGFTAV